jgi:hypothetical protein
MALSDGEARETVSKVRQNIFDNVQHLQDQCRLNGNTILKRWKKKTSDERKAVLLEVDRQMYPHQWCDAYFSHEFVPKAKAIAAGAYSDYDVTIGRDHRPYLNVCLLPYINQEALKDAPTKLLSLLYNRTQYTPEQWAPYDKFLLDKDWELGSFDTTYNANCIVIFGEE